MVFIFHKELEALITFIEKSNLINDKSLQQLLAEELAVLGAIARMMESLSEHNAEATRLAQGFSDCFPRDGAIKKIRNTLYHNPFIFPGENADRDTHTQFHARVIAMGKSMIDYFRPPVADRAAASHMPAPVMNYIANDALTLNILEDQPVFVDNKLKMLELCVWQMTMLNTLDPSEDLGFQSAASRYVESRYYPCLKSATLNAEEQAGKADANRHRHNDDFSTLRLG